MKRYYRIESHDELLRYMGKNSVLKGDNEHNERHHRRLLLSELSKMTCLFEIRLKDKPFRLGTVKNSNNNATRLGVNWRLSQAYMLFILT